VDAAPGPQDHVLAGDAANVYVVTDVETEGIRDVHPFVDQPDDLVVASGL
jgi:hypothetical protein